MGLPAEVEILLDDSAILVVPSFPELEKVLKYQVKKIENKEIKRSTEYLYNEIKDYSGLRAIQLHQGSLQRVINRCRELRVVTHVHDQRLEFPKPQLDKMFGFRFNQKALLSKFLLMNRSGLLAAPTRYGKTTCIINTLRAYPGITTVVTAPGRDLVKQLYADIKQSFPHREVKMIGAGSTARYPSEDITVCSMDSLEKCDHGRTRLVLVDEPHALVTDSRIPEFVKFKYARKLGFGATLSGRFDGRDLLIEALIGPVLAERTYREAVAEGAICPLKVFFLNIDVQVNSMDNRNTIYGQNLFRSYEMGKIIRYISMEILPPDWQTLIFIKNEVQANILQKLMGEDHVIAMAKKLTNKEREELMRKMKDCTITRCLASDIYAQGVTFPDVKAIINAAAGGGYTSAIQKPGRLAEIRPNKKCGVVIDFMFRSFQDTEDADIEGRGSFNCMQYDSQKRLAAYQEKGYEIFFADSLSELDRLIRKEAF
jgi:superfamily II DNA or RNA helicase